jgi:hypothetical protein
MIPVVTMHAPSPNSVMSAAFKIPVLNEPEPESMLFTTFQAPSVRAAVGDGRAAPPAVETEGGVPAGAGVGAVAGALAGCAASRAMMGALAGDATS